MGVPNFYMIKSKLLSTIPQRSALTTSVNSSYIPQAPRASPSQVLYCLNGPVLLIWRVDERMSPFMLFPVPPLYPTYLNLHPFISQELLSSLRILLKAFPLLLKLNGPYLSSPHLTQSCNYCIAELVLDIYIHIFTSWCLTKCLAYKKC